jgi:hypothetical protein
MLPALLGIISPLFGKIIDTIGEKVGVDMSSDSMKSKRLEIELELQKIIAEQEKAIQEANIKQIEVNIEEARSDNVFVSGWRPFIGWVCGIALSYHYLLQPLLLFIAASTGEIIELPEFDMQSLLTVLMGMLGLGAMRTYEKVYGVARNTLQTAKPVKAASPGSVVGASGRTGRLVNDPEAGGLIWRED